MDKEQLLKELQNKMKVYDPSFVPEELDQYIKESLPLLYLDLKNSVENIIQVKCTRELVDKMNKNKEKYGINDKYDYMQVFYTNLEDFTYENAKPVMKFDVTVMFYDNTSNNAEADTERVRFWDFKWKVYLTYDATTVNSTCAKCGANMDYDPVLDILSCTYCQNKVLNAIKNKWRFVDIDPEGE